METPTVNDFMGREIKPGSNVVYPVRRGSKMWMEELRVQQIMRRDSKSDPHINGYNTEGRRITIKNLKNVIVVEPRHQPTLSA